MVASKFLKASALGSGLGREAGQSWKGTGDFWRARGGEARTRGKTPGGN